MIKHIILWKLNEQLTADEKEKAKKNAKINLESLSGKIEGLKSISIITDGLETSNCDMMLISIHEDESAFKIYRESPIHQDIANRFVRPYISQRNCFDFVC